MGEACRHEMIEMERERAECDRMGKEQQFLVQQLEASKRQLNEFKAEHQELHRESILLRRDHDHYGKEAGFLQKLFDEGMQDIQATQQSIEYLETSNQSLFAHIK